MFELARDRLATQLLAIDALDGKLGVVFGAGSLLGVVVAAVLALRANPVPGDISAGLVVVAGGVYLLFLLVCLGGLLPHNGDFYPDLDQVWQDHHRLPLQVLRWQVAADLLGYLRGNEPLQERKRRSLVAALLLLALEGVSGVALLLTATAGR